MAEPASALFQALIQFEYLVFRFFSRNGLGRKLGLLVRCNVNFNQMLYSLLHKGLVVNWSAKSENFASDKISRAFSTSVYRGATELFLPHQVSVGDFLNLNKGCFGAFNQPGIISWETISRASRSGSPVSVPKRQAQPASYCLFSKNFAYRRQSG